MTSKLCEILEKIEECEVAQGYIEKWKNLLDVSKEQQKLEWLIGWVNEELRGFEENLDWWKEKMRKKRNFQRWRKRQREKSKIKKALWRQCKEEDKQRIERHYQEQLIAQKPDQPKLSKKMIKRILALIKLVKCHNKEKALSYKQKLKDLINESSDPEEPAQDLPFLCEAHLQDYANLLSDPSFYELRLQEWNKYS